MSPTKKAVRVLKDGRVMVRYSDGTGLVDFFTPSGTMREALRQEMEGYTDWEPER